MGETAVGHGVFVNCETIRHRAFAISLPGVRMGAIRSGWDADRVREFCAGHALQWAAEIENGKRPDAVLPSKIANFLSASIMSAANGEAVHGVRMSRSTPAADKQAKMTEMRALLAKRTAANAGVAA